MIDKKITGTVSKTYEEVAIEWLGGLDSKDINLAKYFNDTENPEKVNGDSQEIVVRFAHYLDSFNTIDIHMEVVMLRAVQKADRAFMQAMIDFLGVDKAKEIAAKSIGVTTEPEAPVENPISTEDKEC